MSVEEILSKGKQFDASRKQCLGNINTAAKEVCQELSELKVDYSVRQGSSPDDRVEIYFYIQHEAGKIDSLGIYFSNALSKKTVEDFKADFYSMIEARLDVWISNGSKL